MNWYKTASSKSFQEGWTETFGDMQRYALDAYRGQVYLTKSSEKITVSVTISHDQFGTIVWQDFWTFKTSELAKARQTYLKVHEATTKIFDEFKTNETPNNMLYTFVREAVRYIDAENKPDTRVPFVNWARGNDSVADWRGSIYGVRYPFQGGF